MTTMRPLYLLILIGLASPLLSQSWKSIDTESHPTARHENAFVACNDLFYLIGGRGLKATNVYNPKTKAWTAASKPPLEIHHFQAISVDDELWIVGAMTGKYPNEVPLEHILIYQAQTDTWIDGPEIPKDRRRGGCGVLLYKNKIYLLGGIVDGHNGDYQAWTDSYNLKTGEWTILADAPNKRDHFAAVQTKGKIVCAGGRQTSYKTNEVFTRTVAEVDIYNIKHNTWHSAAQPLPTPRAGCSCVAIGKQVIVIGGESGSQTTAHNDVEAYHLKTKTWKRLPALKRGRHGTQAILYQGNIYIAAGCGQRGGSPELQTLEIYQ